MPLTAGAKLPFRDRETAANVGTLDIEDRRHRREEPQNDDAFRCSAWLICERDRFGVRASDPLVSTLPPVCVQARAQVVEGSPGSDGACPTLGIESHNDGR